jgi:hypothetical protein
MHVSQPEFGRYILEQPDARIQVNSYLEARIQAVSFSVPRIQWHPVMESM